MNIQAVSHSDSKELAAFLRHELMNHLTVILGNASSSYEEGDDCRLTEIREAAESALSVVNGVLGSSDGEAVAKLASVMAACRKIQRSSARSCLGRHIELHVDEDLPPAVAFQCHLEQVLQNLLSNAVKYGPEFGTIEFRASTHEGWLLVSVVDDGLGVSLHEREKIFEFGYRSPSASSQPGQGLGLALCRRLVEGWNGRIWCTPLSGGGNAFSFTIPVSSEA